MNIRKKKALKDLVSILRTKEENETHATLQEPLASYIYKTAAENLKREVHGDDDQEFYAEMDRIARGLWNTLERVVANSN